MTRLKKMPEGTIDILGPGIPDDHYHEKGRVAGALTFIGAVAVGFYYGATHLEQAQHAVKAVYTTVEDWLLTH
jgi:hypothetical protein